MYQWGPDLELISVGIINLSASTLVHGFSTWLCSCLALISFSVDSSLAHQGLISRVLWKRLLRLFWTFSCYFARAAEEYLNHVTGLWRLQQTTDFLLDHASQMGLDAGQAQVVQLMLQGGYWLLNQQTKWSKIVFAIRLYNVVRRENDSALALKWVTCLEVTARHLKGIHSAPASARMAACLSAGNPGEFWSI